MQEQVYLCEACMAAHQEHRGLDSVKNHLVSIFDEWHAVFHHASNITQSVIDTNTTKYREILLYLKRNSEQIPDIDVFKLRIIFRNLLQRM